MAESKSTNQRDVIVKVLRSKFHDATKDKQDQPFAVAIIDPVTTNWLFPEFQYSPDASSTVVPVDG